jgi:hypothetical protein
MENTHDHFFQKDQASGNAPASENHHRHHKNLRRTFKMLFRGIRVIREQKSSPQV